MKRTALIGYTGFVGSNLDRQDAFTDRYNSKNFLDMAGQHYGEVVCAGVSAVKWWANQNPEADWQSIEDLCDVLKTVEAETFTLISTVDVYPDPRGVDEAAPLSIEGRPYGRHRRLFEMFVQEQFPNLLTVRLPGVFGFGLKKNLIFDVLERKDFSGFDSDWQFQFYHLDRLTADIRTARAAGLETINLAVEPVMVSEVITTMTGKEWTVKTDKPLIIYDMRTRHSALWGRDDGYITMKSETLRKIGDFTASWHAGKRGASA